MLVVSVVVVGTSVGVAAYRQTKAIIQESDYTSLKHYLQAYQHNLNGLFSELQVQVNNLNTLAIFTLSLNEFSLSSLDTPVDEFQLFDAQLHRALKVFTQDPKILDALLVTTQGDIAYSVNNDAILGQNLVSDFPESELMRLFQELLVVFQSAQDENGSGKALSDFGDIENFLNETLYFPVIGTHLDRFGRLIGFHIVLYHTNIFTTAGNEDILNFETAQILLIGSIVQLIQDIASQVNLLALNATIEAATRG